MHRRRGHTKSRHGCQTCKTRRVKCDEQRPICGNCEERKDTCVYSGTGPFLFPGNRRRKRQNAHSPSEDPERRSSETLKNLHNDSSRAASSDETPAPVLQMDHFELILQWINHTHRLLARNEETRKVWEIHVLQEGLKEPFLMHGVLALSALHLASLRQDNRRVMWLDLAIAHKNTALSMFSAQLQNIDLSNPKAMMTFASLAFAFSLASVLNVGGEEDGPSLSSLTDVFHMARGVQAVMGTKQDFIRESNFAPLLSTARPDANIPMDTLDALDQLEQLLVQCGQADTGFGAPYYIKEIDSMRGLLPFTYDQPTSMTMAGGWAIRLSQEYLEDLQSQKPLALVVLAHYCVFLHAARENWCISSWGRRVFLDIREHLDPGWHPHIQWASLNIIGADT
ncbi:hypothetical protein N7456_003134 [Penicillium angulare]|uniref:Zn(2)-C6 fungal-type domain-containing protein n=1 Tax=Penicillium angulare TaxID=116970 RepID=A0A9W9FU92_9EURO|nr:hypothetical protein N7456_003134 [Penicillium angulare]